ncbi:hypothetical protein GAYE_SCF40G5421 [Galdieria yellowstonensis]|uniref:Cdc23 domain-containing protein n=1 Tax=Galdieria yellowstonensis TaxID=3028027 RepID=A0AAV9IJH7_9RHOD|nr:hypothetical protein GAYE_SCF40G5421 [Galdieria yellowstonensis]
MSSKHKLKIHQLSQLCEESLRNRQVVSGELFSAIQQLSKRGLVYSARWCAELAFSFQTPESTKNSAVSYSDYASEQNDSVSFLLAKRYFDCREYRRCAECLKNVQDETCVFLRCYSLFLAGEKEHVHGSIQAIKKLQNSQLENILSEIFTFQKSRNGALDGFLYYLCGIISRNLERRKQAISFLMNAVVHFPLLFDAWRELSCLVSVVQEEEQEPTLDDTLPHHWMNAFYYTMLWIQRREYDDALQLLNVLQLYFPKNTFLLGQIAYLYYDRREFDESALYYEEIRRNDPYCLDGMDVYSNILYVREQQVELSILAHHCVSVEKYRPETCAVVGNYYSLRGEHEKAVIYFERALKLNPHYVSAFTLIGHEYVEMKNTAKAIEAYRKAVDMDPKDFRAWYGLGQAYELLRMPSYSLYYYRKAASLRPFDSRMWCAMGLCLEEFGKHEDALNCYERALKCEDREVIVFHRIAHLCSRMGEQEKAHTFYLKELELREEDGSLDGPETAEALLFLARYSISKGRLEVAENYCTRLLDLPGTERDQARDLLKEIEWRREQLASTCSTSTMMMDTAMS